jgi:thioredoxin-dependent peroxiredoxin
MLAVGTKAPAFAAPDQDGKTHNLSDYEGKWVLLYFYPKDFTSGCTTEACTLRDNYDGFKKIDAVVLGVSNDSVESHAGFAKEHTLPFTILSDADKKIIGAYEASVVWTKRISYLIDPDGNIAKTYDNVDPAVHAAEVLKDLVQLKK